MIFAVLLALVCLWSAATTAMADQWATAVSLAILAAVIVAASIKAQR